MMTNSNEFNIDLKDLISTLTIKERLSAFRENKLLISEDTITLDDKWLNIKSLVPPSIFIEELEHLDIKKEELAFALKSFTDDEENILIEYLENLGWIKVYKDVIKQFESTYESETVVYEQLVLPFKLFVNKELYNMQRNLKNIKIQDNLIDKLNDHITYQLSKLTWKCLVVEITDYKEQNVLEGKDGKDRYLNFLYINYRSSKQIQSFYRRHPVLCRFITQKMLDLLTSLKEMILNIDVSFSEINDLFSIGTNIIKHIELSLGDTHQYGKSVAEIEFDNDKKYIYKPRNSYIERSFNKLIEFINRNSGLKNLFINNVFYEENFTVEQFVEVEPCTNVVEVKDYYYRFGMLTMLISLLKGTDMHFENVIAHNQYPCIIDFETLFTQTNFMQSITGANAKILNDQVLNLSGTGLLPMNIRLGNMSNEIDFSALSGGTSQSISRKALIAKNVYTDDMCFEYEDSYISKENKNKVTLNGEAQEYKNYKQDIYNGFNDSLDWVLKNASELGIFIKDIFNDLEIRQVMKATYIYADLVNYMDHPYYLGDMVRIEKLLENNWIYSYSDKRLVVYENMDMLHLEIPIFYTNTSKTYLKTSNGNYIKDYFEKDVLSKVINTILTLTKDIIEKEKVKLCVLLGDYKYLVSEKKKELAKEIKKSDLRIYKDEEVIQACNSIAKNIIEAAIIDEKVMAWEYIDDSTPLSNFMYLNNELYSGKSGILLYLYYLNSIEKNDNISKVINYLIEDIKSNRDIAKNTAFKGSAGSIYTLLKYEKNNNFKIIQDTIISLNKDNTEINKINWIDGGASLIKLIYNINRSKYKSPLYLETANKIIQSICKIVSSKVIETYDLGLEHGLIGLLYALLIGQSLLGKVYDIEIETILCLCEKKLQELRNKGLLESPKRTELLRNEIVGLGIGALACKKYIDDSRLDNYINLTIDIINDNSFYDMSMCNGLARELDFLASLSLSKDEPLINQMISMKRSQILDFYEKNKAVLVDELPQFRNYGLFSGLSGVGYSMLRTLFPAEIPSILILD